MSFSAIGLRLAGALPIFAALSIALSPFCQHANAQDFPNRPVRMIVPYPAGGPTDILARKVAAAVEPVLGQPIIVDNRAGANGVVGTDAVSRSAPDGYTILMTGIEQHVGNKLMFKSVTYDPIKDFAPITQINAEPLVLVVHPSLPVKNVKELIDLAASKPGALNFASSSVGSLSHFAGEMLKMMTKIDITHVPYKGGGPAMIDLLSGQVSIYFSGVNGALGYVQSGNLRALAITSKTRSSSLPDIPTLSETPQLKDYEASIKFALWAPANTSQNIITALNNAAVKGLQSPELREFLEKQGSGAPIGNTPAQMAETLLLAEKNLPDIFKAAGITQQ